MHIRCPAKMKLFTPSSESIGCQYLTYVQRIINVVFIQTIYGNLQPVPIAVWRLGLLHLWDYQYLSRTNSAIWISFWQGFVGELLVVSLTILSCSRPRLKTTCVISMM